MWQRYQMSASEGELDFFFQFYCQYMHAKYFSMAPAFSDVLIFLFPPSLLSLMPVFHLGNPSHVKNSSDFPYLLHTARSVRQMWCLNQFCPHVSAFSIYIEVFFNKHDKKHEKTKSEKKRKGSPTSVSLLDISTVILYVLRVKRVGLVLTAVAQWPRPWLFPKY